MCQGTVLRHTLTHLTFPVSVSSVPTCYRSGSLVRLIFTFCNTKRLTNRKRLVSIVIGSSILSASNSRSNHISIPSQITLPISTSMSTERGRPKLITGCCTCSAGPCQQPLMRLSSSIVTAFPLSFINFLAESVNANMISPHLHYGLSNYNIPPLGIKQCIEGSIKNNSKR